MEVEVPKDLSCQGRIPVIPPDSRGQPFHTIVIEPPHQSLSVTVTGRQAVLRKVLSDVVLELPQILEPLRPRQGEESLIPDQILDGPDRTLARIRPGWPNRGGIPVSHRGLGSGLTGPILDTLDLG